MKLHKGQNPNIRTLRLQPAEIARVGPIGRPSSVGVNRRRTATGEGPDGKRPTATDPEGALTMGLDKKNFKTSRATERPTTIALRCLDGVDCACAAP